MAFNTIKLKKYLDVIIERIAYAAITPGMLCELYSTSGYCRKHATSGGNAVPIFALEDELQGKGITDAYAAGDKVQLWVAQRGEEVNALLADGENVAIGDFLVSNGDGYLKKYAFDSAEKEDLIVAQALEAIDRSSSSGGDTNVTGRIRVMVV
jgi:hypothetical protein